MQTNQQRMTVTAVTRGAVVVSSRLQRFDAKNGTNNERIQMRCFNF
jgi:hypothetical protein